MKPSSPANLRHFQGHTGWPEVEFLLKREYGHKGYGTEFFAAVMDSWWDLPREMQRHQLFPGVVPDNEPGDEVDEVVGFAYEETNDVARAFFAKMMETRLGVPNNEGLLRCFDHREGREGTVVRWTGPIALNPNAGRRKAEEE
jgi:hypothetical protein